jgi:hypothetical protein
MANRGSMACALATSKTAVISAPKLAQVQAFGLGLPKIVRPPLERLGIRQSARIGSQRSPSSICRIRVKEP